MRNPNRRVACYGTLDEYVAVTPNFEERTVRLDIQATSDVEMSMNAAHRLCVVLLNVCDDILARRGRDL